MNIELNAKELSLIVAALSLFVAEREAVLPMPEVALLHRLLTDERVRQALNEMSEPKLSEAFNKAAASGLSHSFMAATDHAYQCRCEICRDWWVDMGPDGYDNFGPFTWEEISARATSRGVPFTRGVKDE